jgi:hypothetical protein
MDDMVVHQLALRIKGCQLMDVLMCDISRKSLVGNDVLDANTTQISPCQYTTQHIQLTLIETEYLTEHLF